MPVDVLVIDAFGPLLHRATGQAGVGASTLLRRAAAEDVRVVVTDLRGAEDVEADVQSAGIEVPPEADVVPASDGSTPCERVQGVAEAAGVHPAQCATVISTPGTVLDLKIKASLSDSTTPVSTSSTGRRPSASGSGTSSPTPRAKSCSRFRSRRYRRFASRWFRPSRLTWRCCSCSTATGTHPRT